MTAADRVRQGRVALGTVLAVRAVLWAVAVLLAGWWLAGALAALALPSAATVVARAGAAVLAMGMIIRAAIRARRALEPSRVALWMEERQPALHFALVTAVDPRVAGTPAAGRLERRLATMPSTAMEGARALRALRWPALAAVAALALTAVAPGMHLRIAARTADRAPARGVLPAELPRFLDLRAEIRPPAYTGLRPRAMDDPVRIVGISGSRVTVSGEGSVAGMRADLADTALRVANANERWATQLTLGSVPGVLRLERGGAERLITLEPVPDSTPGVLLTAPARDSVFRSPVGTITLAADVHDDIGLVSGAFEYIVSSGEGESFTFRSGTVGDADFARARSGKLSARLDLGRLSLKPGDIVHLRAVARDARAPGGPNVGASETRTLRIARAGEYDSVAVEGAPPPDADQSLVSQRMLIILTEKLHARRSRITRATLLEESRTISRDQARLRTQVGEIIFARLGDDPSGDHAHGGPDDDHGLDTITGPLTAEQLLRLADAATGARDEVLDFEGAETPVVAINKPLLEAYNHMWDATRALDQGETGEALPPMRRALEAIQRARQAERIYLRGRPPQVVVDLARVRLTGTDTGQTSTRVAGTAADPGAALRSRRFRRALSLLARDATAAVDSLTLLRVELLTVDAGAASALGDAIEALRGGRDATDALRRARGRIDGTTIARPGLPAWSGRQ